MENLQLTAIYVPAKEGGYTAYIAELRGIVTQGETFDETHENLLDALELMLETEREEAERELKEKTNIIKKSFKITI